MLPPCDRNGLGYHVTNVTVDAATWSIKGFLKNTLLQFNSSNAGINIHLFYNTSTLSEIIQA